MTASEAFAGRNIDKYIKGLDTPMPLLADLQKRENIVAGCEAELEERQRTLRRQEDEVKDRESTVFRREIEVDEKERNVERTTASLVRKRRELKILEKSIKRREEALREDDLKKLRIWPIHFIRLRTNYEVWTGGSIVEVLTNGTG
ncbi:unnamed protein product [Alternaria sp. RS040]